MQNFALYNEFLQAMIKQQEYSLQDKITIKGIGWYISPLLNAVIMVGEQEDKINVFRALIGEQENIEYQPKRKNKNDPKPPIEIHTLQQTMARICVNLKSKQDRMVKKGVEELNQKIEAEKLDKNKLLIVDCTDILDNTFTGLVANKLAEQYKRPSILLRKKSEGVYGGSCRNYSLFPIVNFKDFLGELDTFNNLGGHGNAFGFEIVEKNIDLTCNKANEILKKVKIEDVHKVDYEIPIGRLKNKHVEQVGRWQDLWGNQLDEPLFAITDIYISTEKIKLIGSKQNLIKFEINNVTFVKKYVNEEIYNAMILKQAKGLNKKHVSRIKMDVIGKFVINTWDNNEYPQIEIIDFNVVEDDEILF
jgi:single-stranded-DNA-specific exonuclease